MKVEFSRFLGHMIFETTHLLHQILHFSAFAGGAIQPGDNSKPLSAGTLQPYQFRTNVIQPFEALNAEGNQSAAVVR